MAPSVISQRTVPVLASKAEGDIAQATVLSDLIEVLPIVFKTSLAPILQRVHKETIKLCGVVSQVAQLHRHQSENSFPATILGAIGDPKTQFSKEYMSSTDGSSSVSTLSSAVHAARVEYRDQVLVKKQNEGEFLQGRIAWSESIWRDATNETCRVFARTVGGSYDPIQQRFTGGKTSADVVAQLKMATERGDQLWL